MKRVLLGVISVIVLLFIVLVVLDQGKRRSEPVEGQKTQSSGQSPGADGVQQQEQRTPTPISDRTIKLALSLPQADANMVVQLLPSADQLVAGDAYVLYEEACNASRPYASMQQPTTAICPRRSVKSHPGKCLKIL